MTSIKSYDSKTNTIYRGYKERGMNMSDFKDSWKQTGTELGHAFRDLGKTLIKTGKKGVDSAVEWANGTSQTEEQASKMTDNPAAGESPEEDHH